MGTKSKLNKWPYMDPGIQWRIKDIALPTQMNCDRCNKNKATYEAFSQNQRDKAKYGIMRQGEKIKKPKYQVRCLRCVEPLTEIECTVCGECKRINSFARSQRTNPTRRYVNFRLWA